MNDLPLRSFTPSAWASRVLTQPLALLNDHAHLEKKAAANAMDLMHRARLADEARWTTTMAGIARDEVEHLGIVLKLLHARGGRMTPHHRNPYAAALRGLVRVGGREELIDRLLVSALIELRSCERFAVLAAHGSDAPLARLYRGLRASEAGHYRVFVKLAHEEADDETVTQRWNELLNAEADILAEQPAGCGMHSGVGV